MNRDYHESETPVSRAAAEVSTAFRAVITQVVLHNYAVAEAVGLSPRDMQAIHLLQLRGPMSPGELGEALGLASASTTALVDRIEQAGYVKRERDTNDRRKVVVSLNEARLARDLAPRYAEQADHLDRVAGRFNSDELRIIARFLTDLASNP